MQQVNLYNPLFEKKRELLSLPGLVLAWSGAFVLVAAATVAMGMRTTSLEASIAQASTERTAAQAQMAQLAAQLASRRLSPALETELRDLEANLASRKEAIRVLGEGAIGDTKGFSEHLKAFARQSFDGLWLTGLSVSNAGRDIVLQGRTLSPDSVPSYVQRLNRELVMRGRSFAELEMHRPETNAAAKAAPVPAYIEFRLATVVQKPATGARN